METENPRYDCAIIGGGLAGLCLSIQLADAGLRVILFEKNEYPFHKVCGEYISMESWGFLESLGVPLSELDLPIIKKLSISAQSGFTLHHELDLGGFGISRYYLDALLAKMAIEKGVELMAGSKVQSVQYVDENWQIRMGSITYHSHLAFGSFGKYFPVFINKLDGSQSPPKKAVPNFIGVKYHIKTDLSPDTIQLHNFKGGYCGVSKIEADKYCFCYLTDSQNLVKSGGDISEMEQRVLSKNPFLKNYFNNAEFLWEQPIVVSNIHFQIRKTSVGNLLLLGDAAGAITPLCGNGMSMAMRGSKILANHIIDYYDQNFDVEELKARYFRDWNGAFKTRITAGYYLQRLFGKERATNLALKFLARNKWLTGELVKLTHGDRF